MRRTDWAQRDATASSESRPQSQQADPAPVSDEHAERAGDQSAKGSDHPRRRAQDGERFLRVSRCSAKAAEDAVRMAVPVRIWLMTTQVRSAASVISRDPKLPDPRHGSGNCHFGGLLVRDTAPGRRHVPRHGCGRHCFWGRPRGWHRGAETGTCCRAAHHWCALLRLGCQRSGSS